MKSNLDAWMSQLARLPPDRNLTGLEDRIQRDIADVRRQKRAVRALTPACIIALGMAVIIGVAAGATTAVSAPHAPQAGVLATGSELAPSALLAGT